MAARGAHFKHIDTAMSTLKKVEDYIEAGMETTVDIGVDLAVEGQGDANKMSEIKDVMLDFIKMGKEYKVFVDAVAATQAEALAMGDTMDVDYVKILEEKVAKLSKELAEDPHNHPQYKDMCNKMDESQSAENRDDGSSQTEGGSEEDEDLAVTQQELNTKCPYTRKEMTDPVKNCHCGHNYERSTVMQMMKGSRKRIKCPVPGCRNDNPIEMKDLLDNKELKRFINKATKKKK